MAHKPNTRETEIRQTKDALVSQTVEPLEILVIEGNRTAFENNNIGWKRAKGNIIWFLADDTIPCNDALEKALEVFIEHDPDGVEGHIYGKLNRIYEWGFMSGHIFYKKTMLRKVNGLDERFTAWRGDTDLAWSILDTGGKIIYCPLSRAEHPYKSGTVQDMEAEKLLREKHPERYETAKRLGYLETIL